jgi:hypothetical protein
MSAKLRNISLALLAGAALVVAGALPRPSGLFGSQPAFAQGHGGGHGGGGGSSHSSSSGGGSSHSGGSGGSATSANTQSTSHNRHANTVHSQSRTRNSYAYSGSQSGSGVPKAVIRQYVLETGLSQGEVASTLKSWNSLNRNPRAFAATLNNPHSLAALQVAYIRDNMLADQQLAAYEALGGDPASPPTEQQYQDAQQVLSDAGVSATDVLNDPSSYDQSVVDAATVVAQYDAWTSYQTAAATATDAFKAASVSDRNADPATLDALRKLVDDIVKSEGLDTMVSSL